MPERSLANQFKQQRFNKVARALLTRNLLIPLTRKPAVADLGDVVTGYSLPLQEDVMLWGFTWTQSNTEPSSDTGRMLKLQVNGRELILNTAAGFNTLNNFDQVSSFTQAETGYGVSNLPCPIIVPAGGRIVAQFSYNPSSGYAGQEMNTSQYDSILLLCLGVKNCLTDEDKLILEQCRQWIDTHEYQNPVKLNMVTPPVETNLNIVWGGTNGGGGINQACSSQSRPVGIPLLVRGLETNLMWSRLQLRDTRGHDFTPAGQFLARNLCRHAAGNDAPISVDFQFPVAHVLAPGAQLHAEHLDGTGANLGATIFDGLIPPPDEQIASECWLTFDCITP